MYRAFPARAVATAVTRPRRSIASVFHPQRRLLLLPCSRRTKVFSQQQPCAYFHSTGVLSNDNKMVTEHAENDESLDEIICSSDLVDLEEEYLTKRRLWLDPKAPIAERVSRFVHCPLGAMHPLDITIGSIDLIKQCGKLHSFEGMKFAQDILDRLVEEKKHCNDMERWPLVVVPDRPFQYVMYGWANLCKRVPFASQRMRQVLDLMIQEDAYDQATKERVLQERQEHNLDHVQDDDDDDVFQGLSCQPTVVTYNTLIQGLTQAATRSIQAAIEAQETLSVMDKMHHQKGWHTKPNTRSYSLVLNAYAKCQHPTAGERAEKVLRDMVQRHEQEKQLYLEDHGEEYSYHDAQLNKRRIVTPDVIAYTSCIQAYGNSNTAGAADKALGLLSELVHSNHPALQPDAFAFANTINVYSKMAAKKASPDARMEAAQRAEEIWWLLVETLKQAKAGDSGEDMQQHALAGSIVPFNSALKAHAVSFTESSPHAAEKLLHRLLEPEMQDLTQLRPDTVSFNTVMQAWANAAKVDSGTAPERAEEILKLLQSLAEDEDPDRRIYPDVHSYAAVMDAYAVARRSDSVYHVRRLLNELLREGRERYLEDDKQINAVPFTVMLKAVAKASPRSQTKGATQAQEDPFGVHEDDADVGNRASISDPYSVALETYSNVQNDVYRLGVEPDHFVFAAMLDVIAVYTDVESVERRQRTEEVFQDACREGQVSSLVIKSLQKACPNEQILKELLQLSRNDAVVSIESVNVFPRQWTRFVPPQFRRVTQRKDHFRKKSEHYRKNKGQKNGKARDEISNKERKKRQSNKDFIF